MAKKSKKSTATKSGKKTRKPKASASPSIFSNKIWIGSILILLILGYLSYAPSLNNGFTNWDDEVYVVNNDMLLNMSGENLKRVFSEPVSANYHPLTMFSLAMNYSSAKLDPFPYHLTNLVLHLINVILVFSFFWFFVRGKPEVAFITAFIFGIHPMHVESVAWISERKDVLYGLFFVLGMLSYLRYIRTNSAKFLWLALALFLGSILSKAMAVVFPLVMLLMDYFEGRNLKSKPVLIEKIPFFLLSMIFGLLAVKVQSEGGAVGEFETFALHQRFMFAGYGFLMYIFKLFVPIGLSTYYPYPSLGTNGWLPAIYYFAPFLSLGIVGIAIWKRNNWKSFAFGIGFYLATVLLVLQFMSVGQVVMADRYTYLPYIGLGFILAVGFSRVWRGEGLNTILKYSVAGFAGVFFLWLIYGTNMRSRVWESSETLWTNVIDQYPNIGLAHKNRGNFRARNGRTEDALKDFDIARQLLPKDAALLESLGNTYAGMGRMEEALANYNMAIQMDSTKSSAFLNRAIALSQAKQFNQALRDYDKALQLGQKRISVLPNRAYAYLDAGQYQNSISDYEEVIRMDPSNGMYFYFLSVNYSRMGNKAKARELALQARNLGYQVEESYLQSLN